VTAREAAPCRVDALPPSARGYRRGRREEPAPRYRIRRDDGRERIDTPAAGRPVQGRDAQHGGGVGPPRGRHSSPAGWAESSSRVGVLEEGRVRATGTHTHLLEHA
jgi:hypothetical protein